MCSNSCSTSVSPTWRLGRIKVEVLHDSHLCPWGKFWMLQSISLSLEHIVHTTRSVCLRYNMYALLVPLMPLHSPLSVFLEYSLCPSLSLDLLWLLPWVWTKHHGCVHTCPHHPPTLALSDLTLGCTLGFASFQMKQSHWWIGRQHRE